MTSDQATPRRSRSSHLWRLAPIYALLPLPASASDGQAIPLSFALAIVTTLIVAVVGAWIWRRLRADDRLDHGTPNETASVNPVELEWNDSEPEGEAASSIPNRITACDVDTPVEQDRPAITDPRSNLLTRFTGECEAPNPAIPRAHGPRMEDDDRDGSGEAGDGDSGSDSGGGDSGGGDGGGD